MEWGSQEAERAKWANDGFGGEGDLFYDHDFVSYGRRIVDGRGNMIIYIVQYKMAKMESKSLSRLHM